MIFAVERYRQIAGAFMTGLERRLAAGKPITDLWSVASFFVSRVDTKVDGRLDNLLAHTADPTERGRRPALKGRAALANAKLAYQLFQSLCASPRWQQLAEAGAHVQRPLWASTGTKNAAYPDLLYGEGLIGPQAVNTMPPATIAAFNDHGKIARTVDQEVAVAHQVIHDLASAGVDLQQVTLELEHEAVSAFTQSYAALHAAIATKRHNRRQGGRRVAGAPGL